MNINTPSVKKIAKELTTHGHTRIDNYYWLNDRENPEVIKYVEDENAYTKEQMKDTEVLQEELFQEIVGRIKQDDSSVPYLMDGYWYYSRYEKGKEHPIHCRKKGSLEAEEETLLDVNELARKEDYCQVNALSVSESNKFLAFSIDTVGRRIYTVRFKNLETGEYLTDELQQATGEMAWSKSDDFFFYTVQDEETLRSHKIFRHRMGAPSADDVEIFHEKDETFATAVHKSKSNKYLVISSHSTLTSEVRLLPADQPEGDFQVFTPREREHEYSVFHHGDTFYVLTNDKAKNFRLMETSENNTSKEHWKEVIPHRPNVLLEGLEIFDQYMVLEERSEGLTHLRVINTDTKEEHYLDFGEETYTAYVGTNMEFDSEVLRFGYTSLTTPSSVFDYNMRTGEKVLKKQQEVVGDFSPMNYQSKRVFVTAQDGTQVPVSLVWRKGTPLDGTAPLLQYAYGSYGISSDPYFGSARLSLLDRGWIFAIAHIRGGEEMGRHWYEDGKLLKKMNTFTDFIDCAEALIEQKFTSPEHLYAMGGSAGGLLMGAIINLRPDLFHGIVSAVPFVDVVTTMLDDSIPLTTGEYDEWGNPNDKLYYDYMLSYSPYDQVEEKAYPAMLVTSGLHDSQVQYWEPTKWVAKLRELKTDNNLLLLHTNMSAGHSGASGRFETHRETALEFAFLLKLEG